MRVNTARLNTMHVKTGVQSGSARKAPKDRAKIAESAIIIKTRKRAGRYSVIIISKIRMPQSNQPASVKSDGIHPASFF